MHVTVLKKRLNRVNLCGVRGFEGREEQLKMNCGAYPVFNALLAFLHAGCAVAYHVTHLPAPIRSATKGTQCVGRQNRFFCRYFSGRHVRHAQDGVSRCHALL